MRLSSRLERFYFALRGNLEFLGRLSHHSQCFASYLYLYAFLGFTRNIRSLLVLLHSRQFPIEMT